MALLTAYFDESGINPDEHTCVVAGFIGNNEQWTALADDWIKAIHPRKNLHMRALRWKQHPDRVEKVLAKTGPIPSKYNLTPVGVSLGWDDYSRIAKGKVSEEYRTPYMLCAVAAVSVVLLEVVGKNDEVYFLFDRHEGLRTETMNAVRDVGFEWFGMDSRYRGLDFIPRKPTVCLDPGDYLAYILRESAIDPRSYKARVGKSIINRKIHGGKIPVRYFQWLVDGDQRPDGLERAIHDLAQHPFFRGPKRMDEAHIIAALWNLGTKSHLTTAT